jgi:hypothetical protein
MIGDGPRGPSGWLQCPRVVRNPPRGFPRQLRGALVCTASTSGLSTPCSFYECPDFIYEPILSTVQPERSRNGPGKRAPARGGDVRRSRAAAGDVVRPSSYRAVRPMLDQTAGLRLVQLWLETGAELTHQDGYGTPLARVDDWSMRFVVSFCSAALAHVTRTGLV